MTPRRLRVVWILAAAGCAGALPARAPAPREPSATPGARVTGCEGCHAAIATEWQSSFHRTAFVDGTYQASLALEETKEHAFCNRCHDAASTRAGLGAGVDCISCHGSSAHRTPKTNAASGSCATCHEFTFDDGRPELVQKTVTEHAASDFAGVTCAECHMEVSGGHKDHRFLSSHAPERVGRALQVSVTQGNKESSLRIAIQSSAGHAFPTGDMFRRARLVVFAEGADGQIVANTERTFGRTWGGVRGGQHAGARTEVSDTRIRGSWHEDVELEAPTAPITHVRWSIVYERVVAMRGAQVTLASSDVVAEGELEWKLAR